MSAARERHRELCRLIALRKRKTRGIAVDDAAITAHPDAARTDEELATEKLALEAQMSCERVRPPQEDLSAIADDVLQLRANEARSKVGELRAAYMVGLSVLQALTAELDLRARVKAVLGSTDFADPAVRERALRVIRTEGIASEESVPGPGAAQEQPT